VRTGNVPPPGAPAAVLTGRLARYVVALAVLAVIATATAQLQIVVTGTLEGQLDGEERNWYSLARESNGELTGATRLSDMGFAGFETYILEATWFPEQTYASVGKLTLMGSFMSGLDECPCELDQILIKYFLTPDPLVEYYESLEAQVVIDSFTVGGDGKVSATGSIIATLGYVAGPMVSIEPDPNRTVQLNGTFVIDRLLADFDD